MYLHYSMNPEQLKVELNRQSKAQTTGPQSMLGTGAPGTIETPEINPIMNMAIPQIIGTINHA